MKGLPGGGLETRYNGILMPVADYSNRAAVEINRNIRIINYFYSISPPDMVVNTTGSLDRVRLSYLLISEKYT